MLIVPALGARAAAHWQTSAVASRSSLCKPIEGPIASLNAIYSRSLDSLPTGVAVGFQVQTVFRAGRNGTCDGLPFQLEVDSESPGSRGPFIYC